MDNHFHTDKGDSAAKIVDTNDGDRQLRSDGEVFGRKAVKQHVKSSDVERDGTDKYRSQSGISGVNQQNRQNEDQLIENAVNCDPCLSEDTTVAAHAYCRKCDEHLCKTCIRFHKKFSATAAHKLYGLEVITDDTDPRGLSSLSRNMEALHLHQQADTFRSRLSDMVPTHRIDIGVKTADDKFDCNITGLAMLSSGNVVLCDNENRALKLVSVKTHQVIIQYKLQSNPWDVVVIKDDLIAVSLPFYKTIQMFSVRNAGFTNIDKLNVDGICLGLACSNGNLVVSYDGKVEILDTNGMINRSFTMCSDLKPETGLPEPWYITAGSGLDCVAYVSHRASDVISRIPITRTRHIRHLMHGEISYPAGISLVNGTELVICCWDSHTIQLLNVSRGSARTVVLNEGDGLQHPQAVCYSEEGKKLFVSSYWYNGDPKYLNSIQVFQFKHKVMAPNSS